MQQRINDNEFVFGVRYADYKTVQSLHLAFSKSGYVKLPGLIEPTTFTALRAEVETLSRIARHKDFVMSGYETPRIMTTLGGKEISANSETLRRFYKDNRLRAILAGIIGGPVFDSYDANEWCVATWLNGRGETHGYHLDDPPIALIVILKAPASDLGGSLEMIADWREIARIFGHDPEKNVLPLVERLRRLNLVQSKAHAAGDAYLLRADQCLHAVTPLRSSEAQRCILNMAFELEPDIVRQSDTAAALFEN